MFKNIFSSNKKTDNSFENKIKNYISGGRIPWSEGYIEYKHKTLYDSINNNEISNSLDKEQLPNNYGIGLDERIVEIPWVLNKLNNNNEKLLDAGSSLNFKEIVTLNKVENKDLTILTYDPEKNNFSENRISYIYSDLRDLPFKNNLFDSAVCISTIEHIDMDNSIYGWNKDNDTINNQIKSYDYLKVIDELLRVLKSEGQLIITFPFGKFENHGFFQQFDAEMKERIIKIFNEKGSFNQTYFKYETIGWKFCTEEDCKNIVSHNPHTGKGKLDDGAAHCRSVCCLEFIKK